MVRTRLPLNWMLALVLTVVAALLVSLVLPRLSGGFMATYIFQPAIWLLLFTAIRRFPRYRGLSKIRQRPVLIKFALGIAAFQIYLMVIAGFLDRFGKSPNSFTPQGIVINLCYVISGLLGMEFSRAWLLNRILRRPAALPPALIAFGFTLVTLPCSRFPHPGATLEAFTRFIGSDFLPVFMENLLASCLAMWGGPWPALAYRGTLAAFTWFCPVVPDLNWALRALTGTVVPAVGLAVIQEYCSGSRRRLSRGSILNYVSLSVVAVMVIWFSLGVFPVRPAVIYSGSMRPTLEVGDIAIVARQNPRRLKKGDVISFRVKDSPVPTVHRIVAIGQNGGKETFITRGDANHRNDDPVPADNVIGKVVLVVPRLGWASIAIRRLFI